MLPLTNIWLLLRLYRMMLVWINVLLVCISLRFWVLLDLRWILRFWFYILLISCIFFLIGSWMNMLWHEVEILWLSLPRTSSLIASCPSLLLRSSFGGFLFLLQVLHLIHFVQYQIHHSLNHFLEVWIPGSWFVSCW